MAQSVTYTSIKGTVLRESSKAVFFRVEEISGSPIEHASHWFPISRIEKRTTDPSKEGTDTLVLESWLIDKFCEEHGI